MEIKESVIIGFLLVIVIILIFSNISVSFGESSETSSTSEKSGGVSSPTNKTTTPQPTPTKFDPQNSDLLSNDIKKQLKELDAMYYTNKCKI